MCLEVKCHEEVSKKANNRCSRCGHRIHRSADRHPRGGTCDGRGDRSKRYRQLHRRGADEAGSKSFLEAFEAL